MKTVRQDIGSKFSPWVGKKAIFTDADGRTYECKCTNVMILYENDDTKVDLISVRGYFNRKYKETYWVSADRVRLAE